jgi:outer membrane protein OmpA-like peptidoglycan-associated protein
MKNHLSVNHFCLLVAVTAFLVGTVARAQNPPAPAPQVAPAKAPDSLSIYFDPGSAAVTAQGQTTLDQAARTYRDGKPIVMVISGGTDSTGSAAANLRLSQQRADNVLQGLVARGIPVERFQILAKGETEPAVPAPEGTPEARNRRVEITWR